MLPTCRLALLPWPERTSIRIAEWIVLGITSRIKQASRFFQRLPARPIQPKCLIASVAGPSRKAAALIGTLPEQVPTRHPRADDACDPNIIHLSMHSGVNMKPTGDYISFGTSVGSATSCSAARKPHRVHTFRYDMADPSRRPS
jgi:hypothetical protein